MIGVGIDAVDLDRFRRVVARTPGVVERVLTAAERAYGARHADPVPHWAGRFAVKEAVMKALGVGIGAFAFHDVEVGRAGSGAPLLALRGGAGELAATRGVTAWHVSITHTDQVAQAIAVAV